MRHFCPNFVITRVKYVKDFWYNRPIRNLADLIAGCLETPRQTEKVSVRSTQLQKGLRLIFVERVTMPWALEQNICRPYNIVR